MDAGVKEQRMKNLGIVLLSMDVGAENVAKGLGLTKQQVLDAYASEPYPSTTADLLRKVYGEDYIEARQRTG